MNLWECGEPGCTATALGEGGAIGLRAVGWYFEPGPVLRCPAHRPDGETERRFMGCERPVGEPCSPCRAEMEAERYQVAMGARPWLERFSNEALKLGARLAEPVERRPIESD